MLAPESLSLHFIVAVSVPLGKCKKDAARTTPP
jgi:hypothetical protein